MQHHIVLKPSANFNVTISDTTAALTLPSTDVILASFVVETADVRMTIDGSAPVAGSNGYPMSKNTVWEIYGRDIIIAMRFIREAATDALISGIYLKGE